MPPGGGGGGGGGEHGRTKQDHPPATGRRRDQDTPPLPTPPFPTVALQVYQRRKKQRQLNKQHAAASIPEDVLFEILSRVPYMSLCRFKCVSRSWHALCSDPDIRKRSPQTLSGFFHNQRQDNNLKFCNLSGRGQPLVDPALPFLRGGGGYDHLMVEQCSSGLLLCKCWKSRDERDGCDLVVCNPATEKWTVLPPIVLSDEESSDEEEDGDDPVCFRPGEAYLGFDAAIPSLFVVFVPLLGRLDDAAIYSSETGQWIRRRDDEAVPVVTAECVFLNGFMHLTIDEPEIAVVDTEGEGEDWHRIALPDGMEPSYGNTSMGQSRGLLHAWYIDPDEYQLSVWVLEDYYDSDKWTLKHTADILELFDTCDGKLCEIFAIHPERNLIFITNGEDTTLSYDMDNREVHVMCTSGEFLGGLPYIPCFADWLSDGQ